MKSNRKTSANKQDSERCAGFSPDVSGLNYNPPLCGFRPRQGVVSATAPGSGFRVSSSEFRVPTWSGFLVPAWFRFLFLAFFIFHFSLFIFNPFPVHRLNLDLDLGLDLDLDLGLDLDLNLALFPLSLPHASLS